MAKKNEPTKTISVIKQATAIVGLIAAIGGLLWAAQDHLAKGLASKAQLKNTKSEIINEFRLESAKTRSVYLRDLEDRLLEAELEVENLTDADKNVPSKLRRRLKQLQKLVVELNNEN